ncbi:cupin domain-containing protein [Rubripirellula reticaptiva]|uniref:Cupin domain protein n=1 Tax=Rubripirellula reticaptiva TaxID=2528013 RepID=A0A5C6ET27_9BACT|nr:cupin domain-containing protein [Rubripirellula reticaptiva]TWU51237.1 hypothetical protein Poly59_28290 [Rubripirellula reticaptiva]
MMVVPQVTPKASAECGAMGRQNLATGMQVSFRRWQQDPSDSNDAIIRDYEIMGHMIDGALELGLGGETVSLRTGDSWLVPQGAQNRCRVVEPIIAIEAASPPARFNDLDEHPTKAS